MQKKNISNGNELFNELKLNSEFVTAAADKIYGTTEQIIAQDHPIIAQDKRKERLIFIKEGFKFMNELSLDDFK